MSVVISFNTLEWNNFRELLSDSKWPWLHISRRRVIATDGKVAIARKLKCDATGEGIHAFIHLKHMPRLVGNCSIKIRIGDSVQIRLPNNETKTISEAFERVPNFPKLKSLVVRESSQNDTSVTFSVTRSMLERLLKASASQVFDITVHSDSFIGKWKAENEIGFFSQLERKVERS